MFLTPFRPEWQAHGSKLRSLASPQTGWRWHGLRPFRYFDKGSMAVVGKGFAVLQSGTVRISGFMAWLAWAAVHLEFLAEHNLRVSVFVQWVWTFVTGQRGSRLIVDHTGPGSAKSIPAIAPAAAPSSQPPVTAVVSSK
jgi:hypothetical protein